MQGSYRRNKTFLGDEEYGRALDALVKGCADVLMQDAGTGEVTRARRCARARRRRPAARRARGAAAARRGRERRRRAVP